MCLIIEKSFYSMKELHEFASKPLIAKKDIKVYKVLGTNNISPYRKMLYEKNFEYTEHQPFTYYCSDELGAHALYLRQGLYSFTRKSTAKNSLRFDRKIVEMIIPKGAQYFKGVGSTIVSNKLIWY